MEKQKSITYHAVASVLSDTPYGYLQIEDLFSFSVFLTPTLHWL